MPKFLQAQSADSGGPLQGAKAPPTQVGNTIGTVGNVLGLVGDFAGVPILSTIGKIAGAAGRITQGVTDKSAANVAQGTAQSFGLMKENYGQYQNYQNYQDSQTDLNNTSPESTGTGYAAYNPEITYTAAQSGGSKSSL